MTDGVRFDAGVAVIDICDAPSSMSPLLGEFALKLALNGITTGANVVRAFLCVTCRSAGQIKGRVFGNTMINLTVSNNKVGWSVCGLPFMCAAVSPLR